MLRDSPNRPGVVRLMADIESGKIDVVVVYKVDRLSRSLHDFAKMVEVFDRHGVSFVSVTQQFNTTTSMGRLTLNVLLSFAQFEREVTGERIRDKIAASKKKGMWMGGFAPIGYDIQDKKLIVNNAEAATVILIFEQYLQLRSVRLLCRELEQSDIRSKVRAHQSATRSGGACFSRGALYHLLRNPLYIGKIRFKDQIHEGQHEAIIAPALWDAAQQTMEDSREGTVSRYHRTEACTLKGKLFDAATHEALTIVHASNRGRRYRYYISASLKQDPRREHQDAWRLPSKAIEQTVVQAIRNLLRDRIKMMETLRQAEVDSIYIPSALAHATMLADPDYHGGAQQIIGEILQRVELRRDGLNVTLALNALLPNTAANHAPIMLHDSISMTMQRRGQEMRMMIAGHAPAATPDPVLITSIARARQWSQELINGRFHTMREIAAHYGVSDSYVKKLMPMAFLSPSIIEAIVGGKQPAHLTKQMLIRRTKLPTDWKMQEKMLGL